MSAYINLHDAIFDTSKFKARWISLDNCICLTVIVGGSQCAIFLPPDESALAERVVTAINRTDTPGQVITADPKLLEALAKAREFIATELRWRNGGSWHHGENTYISTPTALLDEIDAVLGKAKPNETL